MLLDVREGLSGDRLDKNVTFRELALLGLAVDPSGAVSASIQGARNALVPLVPADITADGYQPTQDLTPPPAPVNVVATGGIGAVFLNWGQPEYQNHSFTEIWRNVTDDVATASLIATSSSQNYFDRPPQAAVKYYYWVRFVSRADVRGPFSQETVEAVADVNPFELVSKIQSELARSTLFKQLSTRVARVEGDSNTVSSIQNTVRTMNDVTVKKIDTVNATIGTLSTTVQAEAVARAAADNSLFAQYTVKIDQNGHVSGFGLASETVSGTTTSAFIIRADKFAVVDPTSSLNNLTNSPSADAVPFAVVSGTVHLKSAMIQDASISSAKIASLTANKITAGNINAAIGINGAKVYGAELYAGGTVSVNQDGSFSASNPTVAISGGNAAFVAGNFSIKNQASNGTTYSPFTVSGGVVHISTAMIQNASITLAKIDTATITNLSSIKADMGTITAGKMQSTDNLFVIDLTNKFISISV